ncbi:MAG: hypothetical protein ACRENQ_01705, partial [Gemmatimonadaceae bacterium]
DSTFWHLVTTMSEPGGFFRSDNFVSNETSYQRILDRLQSATPPGGVYVGVGPDQNFTYIVALRPRMAFIVDIRRQALLQQLMYKALFEMSPSRADFVSHLFSRALPAGLDSDATPAALFRAVFAAAPDSARYRDNLREIEDRLVHRHRFALSADDLRGLAYVYDAFFTIGPDVSYSGDPRRGRGGRWMPGYAEMMLQTDSAGVNRSYLGSEARYRAIRNFEAANLLVPVVGDFGGPKAIRAVGAYVRAHDALVTTFYTSNVEQYLFRDPDSWRHFYANVAAVPHDSASLFIRAVFGGYGYGRGYGTMRGEMLVTPIDRILSAFDAGKIRSYWDVIALSR